MHIHNKPPPTKIRRRKYHRGDNERNVAVVSEGISETGSIPVVDNV
jgi:hypothetical protein